MEGVESRLNRSTTTIPGKRLTRKRIPLSCVACRVRKLKCNREKPCQNCIVRGEGTPNSCTYAEKAEGRNGKSNPRADAEDMRKRINRLESSILSMMSSDSREGPPLHNITSHVTNSPHIQGELLEPDEEHVTSVDSRSTHWDVILNDLGAMKEAWREENDYVETSSGHEPSPNSLNTYRPNFLNGMAPQTDRATILASLPPKLHTDRLVTRFFSYHNPLFPARHLIHESTFLKHYKIHCADPKKSKTMWIGLLFGIMSYALQSYRFEGEEPPEYHGTSLALADLYRTRTAQCISMAQVTKPVKYMIDTMLLYSMEVHAEEGEGDSGSWLFGGSIVRIAMQQGWHRDPSQHPNVSVFDGEMRRRLWAILSQYDLLLCTKAGIPKSTRFSECDVAPPSNLYPEELYEGMSQLPPSRPLTEETPSLYFVLKYHLMRAFGNVIEFLHDVTPQSYSEVLKIDAHLMETYNMIPPHLQVRSVDDQTNDAPARVTERYLLNLYHHKAVCILHRKYWNERTLDAPDACDFHYSRKTCVSSAMVLVEQQASMHRAIKPGGPLATMKWYQWPVANHDYLLAAMILCLDLMGMADEPDLHSDCIIGAFEKFHYVNQARDIWAEVVDDCKDARRAVRILERIIPTLVIKFEEARVKFPNRICPLTGSVPHPNAEALRARYSPYFSDDFRQSLSSLADPSPGDDPLMQDGILSSGGIIDSISSGVSLPDEFDWDAWDQLVATNPSNI